jgi:AraC-like DNA-binding protein
LSDRQLRRRFEAAVGYGPKTFQRIVRFQRWLDLTRSTPAEQRRLTDLAAEAGYADQSHLTREVSRLAGQPPAALLASPALAPA